MPGSTSYQHYNGYRSRMSSNSATSRATLSSSLPVASSSRKATLSSSLPIATSSSRKTNNLSLSAPVSSPSRKNLENQNEELRSHVSQLKAELLMEKTKSKQTHREKVSDLKKIKQDYDRDRIITVQTTTQKMKDTHDCEIKKVRDSLLREKELEIKQVVKFKDEEIRAVRKHLLEERDLSIKEAEARIIQEYSEKSRNDKDDSDRKLRTELTDLRRSRDEYELLSKKYMKADLAKSDMIRELKEEHARELQRVQRESRKESLRSPVRSFT